MNIMKERISSIPFILKRDIFIRWLLRLGMGRSEEISKHSRLNIPPEEVTFATKSFVRFLLKTTQQPNYPVAKQFIRQDTQDDIEKEQKFMEQEPFNDEFFLEIVKNDCTSYLKRLEMLFYLGSLFDKSSTPWNKIASLKLAGATPSQEWNDEMDKALLYSNFMFGFGIYDHVMECPDSRIHQILGTPHNIIDQIKLDDRTIRLCESAKRQQLSDEKIIESISTTIIQDGWSSEESEQVSRYSLWSGN